jgi:DNA-binding NtrC family response regulator
VAGIAQEVRAALVEYSWPGNVRELANVIERAVLLCRGQEITLAEIPDAITKRARTRVESERAAASLELASFPGRLLRRPLRAAREELVQALERWYLGHWLQVSGGRIGQTARRAGLDPRSLYEKMKEYGLKKEEFRRFLGEPEELDGEESRPRARSTGSGQLI